MGGWGRRTLSLRLACATWWDPVSKQNGMKSNTTTKKTKACFCLCIDSHFSQKYIISLRDHRYKRSFIVFLKKPLIQVSFGAGIKSRIKRIYLKLKRKKQSSLSCLWLFWNEKWYKFLEWILPSNYPKKTYHKCCRTDFTWYMFRKICLRSRFCYSN
jgi:hypothetical protein